MIKSYTKCKVGNVQVSKIASTSQDALGGIAPTFCRTDKNTDDHCPMRIPSETRRSFNVHPTFRLGHDNKCRLPTLHGEHKAHSLFSDPPRLASALYHQSTRNMVSEYVYNEIAIGLSPPVLNRVVFDESLLQRPVLPSATAPSHLVVLHQMFLSVLYVRWWKLKEERQMTSVTL